MNRVSIGVAQLESRVGDEHFDPRPANLERALEAIAELADQGAQLIVFGEIFLNGYESNEYGPRYAVAEDAEDEYVRPLVEAASSRNVTILMGATTHKGSFPGDVFNSVLVITPDGLEGVYSKTHVAAFVFDGSRRAPEKLWWSPGQSLPVFDTPVGRLGIEICYDMWFPEVARTLTLKGADIMVNVSAAVCGFEDAWDHMIFARAVENNVPYLHVSVVGKQVDFELFGGSRLFAADGTVLGEAPRYEEALKVFEVDKDQTRYLRGALHPFHNRNPRLYGEITKPFAGELQKAMGIDER